MLTTPTKLHLFPKLVFTPVAAAQGHFKKEEQAQTTITQWHRSETERTSEHPSSSYPSNSSSDDTAFEPKKSPKKKTSTSLRKIVTTVKIEEKKPPRSVAVCTLGKVDDTIKLKKYMKAKDRGRKKRTGKTTNINRSDMLRPQKDQPLTKKEKVELNKVKEEVSEDKGEQDIKGVPNRNPFNMSDMVTSTAK